MDWGSSEDVAAADAKRQKQLDEAKSAYQKLIAQGGGDDGRPRATPWLLIRYALPDLGMRPIAPGEVFWTSPDITVESSDPLGNPVAGENNFVHAQIFNLGRADAAPVRVDFYWANPALGLGPLNMNLIGTEWLEIRSLDAVDVRCGTPWVPQMLNGGHECLLVNCGNAILDPIIHPFQPTLDRHVGQRNVHVIEASAGATVKFELQINNLFPIAAEVVLTARMEHVAIAASGRELKGRALVDHVVGYGAQFSHSAEAIRQRFRPSSPEGRSARRVARLAARAAPSSAPVRGLEQGDAAFATAGISARLSEGSTLMAQSHPRSVLANLLLAADKFVGTSSADGRGQRLLDGVRMRPFEQRHVELELSIPAAAAAREYISFHIGQTAEGLPMGGYTIVVHVRSASPKPIARQQPIANKERRK